jgi:hypothetical protein
MATTGESPPAGLNPAGRSPGGMLNATGASDGMAEKLLGRRFLGRIETGTIFGSSSAGGLYPLGIKSAIFISSNLMAPKRLFGVDEMVLGLAVVVVETD